MLYYDPSANAGGRLARFIADSFRPGASLPFSFTYGGVSSRELLNGWAFERTADGAAFTAPDGMRAAVELRTFADFDAVEWLLTFENTGAETSALLQDVNALDLYVETAPFRTAGTRQYGALDNILYYSGGSDCKADDFIPCQEILHHISVREEMSFGSMQGRPTSGSHGSFPYFNLKTLDRGVFFAIGWSGQWAMTLRTRRQETPGAPTSFQFTGGMPGVSTVLYPGEKIRTARILLMPWDGTIEDSNLLSRRFLLKYHTPHVDGKPAALPLSLQSWGHDEWRGKAEIDEGVRSGLPIDTYWTDAGWYGPAGSHCDDPLCNDWSDNVGWYTHDPLRYPSGEGVVGQYAHDNGLRYLLWLEPDRAVEGTPNHAEHPEYYLKKTTVANSHMLNLGDEDAYNWALEMLSDKIRNCHLDVMRIDYNIGPLESWLYEDADDRRGMTEIRAVENFYRLWAELRRRFPHLLIDNCASGGRRLDFEANTHSVSLFRTDYMCYADSDATGTQLQTAGLAPFVPLNGLVFKCYDGKPTWYDFLSYLAPGFAITPELLQDLLAAPEQLEEMRRMMTVLQRVRPLFCGDFYSLTGATLDERDWFAYQLNDPETGKGCLLSARRSQCAMCAANYRLKGLDPDAVYVLEDAASAARLGEFSGRSLMEDGYTVTLPQPRSASLVFLTKKETVKAGQAETVTKRKVTLLGDSIRQLGYGARVEDLAGDEFEIWQPTDNCRFAQYTLRGLFDWAGEMEGSDVIHWNNGHWDLCEIFEDGNFTPAERYVEVMVRIAKLLLKKVRTVIFATTTPVKQDYQYNRNAEICRYNGLVVPELKKLGVVINDLHAAVAADPDRLLSDDGIHLSAEGVELCANQVLDAIRAEAAKLD